ncbi:MAG: PKD domain-containing protein [Candidatus Bipolaricaulota bacterium]
MLTMLNVRSWRAHAVLVLVLFGLALALGGCGANRPPVASFSATPDEGYETLVVRLDARMTRDPDGDPLVYAWHFDDGTTASVAVLDRPFSAGTHEVRLVVTDGRGSVSEASRTIEVRDVPDGFVVRHCLWTWRGQAMACDLLIPWDLYQTYRGRLRTTITAATEYGDYVSDPLDDPTLEDYAGILWNLAGGAKEAFVDLTLAFVQGVVAYRVDPTGQEWPWYPLETLTDAEGDCEDTAILFVSLLRARDVPSSLAFVDTEGDRIPDHVLVLVPVSAAWAARLDCPGDVVEIGGTLYAVAETAADGAPTPFGCDPWDLSPLDVARTWPF